MPSTPVELRHVRFSRAIFRGYNRGAVDEVIEEVVESFETVWRERAELADHAELLEKQLEDLRTREALLATTLVSAEKAAADAKQQAKREAELIIAEAHGEARSITRTAQADRERLFAEARRVQALLRSALGMIEEVDAASGVEPAERDDSAPTSWPRREETREFARANLFVAGDEEAQAG